MTHTPGPWRVRKLPDGNPFVDAPSVTIAIGIGYHREILEDEHYPEKLADATLIAAAPELLANARQALSAYRKWNSRTEGGEDDLHFAAQCLETIIAKAESK